jgi:hypothetical protein
LARFTHRTFGGEIFSGGNTFVGQALTDVLSTPQIASWSNRFSYKEAFGGSQIPAFVIRQCLNGFPELPSIERQIYRCSRFVAANIIRHLLKEIAGYESEDAVSQPRSQVIEIK